MARSRLVILLTLAALTLAAPALARPPQAHLSLHTTSHAVLRGSAFGAHERVRVVLRVGTRPAVTRHVTASAAGTFSQVLPAPPCGHFTVTATGSAGSEARLRGLEYPMCIVG